MPLYLSFTSALLPIVVLLDENKGALHITAGFTLLFSLCVLNALGIFGSEFAATLPYPYATAVSSAATGEISDPSARDRISGESTVYSLFSFHVF